MSRSFRKTKIHGITTARSEKQDKRDANRKFRRVSKQKVSDEERLFPVMREVSNVWAFAKDGKIYDSDMRDKEMRK
ncbi:hypothetical protein [Aureibacter tunicatorum]|uniref:Uncharacterized protein n=1 Tax=Aureibacter tunicatorum TaxID=866807 RepID=A0AAE3XMT4_9BACT|nr:hypothetical protein [Aureibacter tunicatorum]MDR6238785.1 hypothetical protein [Aureibacter tunicatorum]BDD05285.1 hypothetical protein AUTU_27680 [Aureibacter tunicatorum]